MIYRIDEILLYILYFVYFTFFTLIEKTVSNYIKVEAILRKIKIRIFLFFCSRCKIATGCQKNGFVCERFYAAILFSKNLLKFFSHTLTLLETYAKPNFNIFILFSLIKSMK